MEEDSWSTQTQMEYKGKEIGTSNKKTNAGWYSMEIRQKNDMKS